MIKQPRLRTSRSLDGLKAEIATTNLQPCPSHRHPEKDLCAAVLEDAIHRAEVFQEERDWILSEERDYLFSFVVLCEVLGMDPVRIRNHLQARWKPLSQTKRRAAWPPNHLRQLA